MKTIRRIKKLFIKYICPKCNKKRVFSTVQNESVTCKECGTKMDLQKSQLAVEVMTTEESRYLADEALYSTIADRVSDKTRVRHT